MNITRIKNISRVPETFCKCGNWLKHWNKYSGEYIVFCSEYKCFEKNVVGACVQKSSSSDNNWYIIPLCKAHLECTCELDISKPLIPIDQCEIFEKELITRVVNNEAEKF